MVIIFFCFTFLSHISSYFISYHRILPLVLLIVCLLFCFVSHLLCPSLLHPCYSIALQPYLQFYLTFVFLPFKTRFLDLLLLSHLFSPLCYHSLHLFTFVLTYSLPHLGSTCSHLYSTIPHSDVTLILLTSSLIYVTFLIFFTLCYLFLCFCYLSGTGFYSYRLSISLFPLFVLVFRIPPLSHPWLTYHFHFLIHFNYSHLPGTYLQSFT